MLVLDTDHMSLLEWGGEGSATLRERLANFAPDEVATTIVSYEEQVRGWMSTGNWKNFLQFALTASSTN